MSDFLKDSVQQANLSRMQGQTDATLNRVKGAPRSPQESGYGPPLPKNESEIDEVANGFEAIFFRMVIKEMKKTVEKTDLMGEDSNAMNMYEEMLDDKLADKMSQEGLGIGNMVKEYIKEMNATSYDPNSPAIKKIMAERVAEYQKQMQEFGLLPKPSEEE